MKIAPRFVFYACLLALWTGCTSVTQLQTSFRKGTSSLTYHSDEPIYHGRKTSVAYVKDPVVEKALVPEPQIASLSTSAVPLLIINTWDQHFLCELGQSQITDDIPAFLKNSIANEIERATPLNTDVSQQQSLTLSTTIEHLGVKGNYQIKGALVFFLFIISTKQENTGVPEAVARISYTLSEDGNVIWKKTVETTSRKVPEPVIIRDHRYLRQMYARVMGDQLSDALQKNVIQSVRALNEFLADQPRLANQVAD